MKRGRRLTRNEKEIVVSYGLDATEWMLAQEMNYKLVLIHKETKQIKTIDKFKRGKK